MIDTKTLRAAIEAAAFEDEIVDLFSMCIVEIESLQDQLAAGSGGGVTMIDDFAMSAQTGLLAGSLRVDDVDPELVAKKAYALAFAMMAERERLATIASVPAPLVLTPVEFPPVEAVTVASGSQEPGGVDGNA